MTFNKMYILQVGFNKGDDTHYYSVATSRTAEVVDIETTSNVNTPGQWVYRIDPQDLATYNEDVDEENERIDNLPPYQPVTVYSSFGAEIFHRGESDS